MWKKIKDFLYKHNQQTPHNHQNNNEVRFLPLLHLLLFPLVFFHSYCHSSFKNRIFRIAFATTTTAAAAAVCTATTNIYNTIKINNTKEKKKNKL